MLPEDLQPVRLPVKITDEELDRLAALTAAQLDLMLFRLKWPGLGFERTGGAAYRRIEHIKSLVSPHGDKGKKR